MNAGGSDCSQQNLEHGELDGLVAERSTFADRINEAEDNSGGILGDFTAADEAKGEEPECTIESRLDNLRVGGFERRDEWLKQEVGIGRRQSVEWGAGGGIGRIIGESLELVESRFAGGNELGVFSPGNILDNLVQRRPQHPPAAGGST